MLKLPLKLSKLNSQRMLGNDVVDLRLAKIQNNWKRQNYLSKIFVPSEQHLIYGSQNPEIVVWQLWSMKEAAYKTVNRNTGVRFYGPKEFVCNLLPNNIWGNGTVQYQRETFLTHSFLKADYVHSLCLSLDAHPEQIRVIPLENKGNYQDVFNSGCDGISLQKNKCGLPEIYLESTGIIHPATVSHHGAFCFVAFLT